MTDRPPRDDLVTVAQAATILGLSTGRVDELRRQGLLTGHGHQGPHGSLSRDQVEQLARDRAAAGAQRNRPAASPAPRAPRRRPDPVDDHDWLGPTEAGAVIGLTRQAVIARCARGRMPATKVDGYWWIRADHARLVANVMATDPEHLPVAVDGLT